MPLPDPPQAPPPLGSLSPSGGCPCNCELRPSTCQFMEAKNKIPPVITRVNPRHLCVFNARVSSACAASSCTLSLSSAKRLSSKKTSVWSEASSTSWRVFSSEVALVIYVSRVKRGLYRDTPHPTRTTVQFREPTHRRSGECTTRGGAGACLCFPLLFGKGFTPCKSP